MEQIPTASRGAGTGVQALCADSMKYAYDLHEVPRWAVGRWLRLHAITPVLWAHTKHPPELVSVARCCITRRYDTRQ